MWLWSSLEQNDIKVENFQCFNFPLFLLTNFKLLINDNEFPTTKRKKKPFGCNSSNKTTN